MKRVFLCLLLALPPGCASQYAADSPQAFCAKQANGDPIVTQLRNQEATEGGENPFTDAKIRFARHRAMQSCLLAKGAAPSGGVEPVERY